MDWAGGKRDESLCAPGLAAVIGDRDRAVAGLGERDDAIAEVTLVILRLCCLLCCD